MYVSVSQGPLPVGVGLPPEARLKPGLLSQLCLLLVKQSGLWASLAEEVGYIWGVCFTATGCLQRPEITTCLTLSKSAKVLQILVQWNTSGGRKRNTNRFANSFKTWDSPKHCDYTEYCKTLWYVINAQPCLWELSMGYFLRGGVNNSFNVTFLCVALLPSPVERLRLSLSSVLT